MQFLVLGGAGFIGSHVVDRLLGLGHSVRVLEKPGIPPYRTSSPEGRLDWVEGDIRNIADSEDALEGVEVVLHLVSMTLPKNSNDNPVFDIESNLISTLRFLELAVKKGVRKTVFASSGGTVYGIPETDPIAESHPTEPLVSYGIGKLAIEKYLALFYSLYGHDYAVLRISNPFGERQRGDSGQGAVAVFLRNALSGKPCEIWGDGSVIRDYIYISNVVDAFVRAVDHTEDVKIFNIGAGTGCSLNQLLSAIEEVVGHPVLRNYLPSRKFDVPANVLDISRARDILGWEPSVGLKDGLLRTVEWLRRVNALQEDSAGKEHSCR